MSDNKGKGYRLILLNGIMLIRLFAFGTKEKMFMLMHAPLKVAPIFWTLWALGPVSPKTCNEHWTCV